MRRMTTIGGAAAVAIVIAAACGTSDTATSWHAQSGGAAGAGGTPGRGGSNTSTGGAGRMAPGDLDGGRFEEAVVVADPAPPPISGGTLTLINQGRKAAVADPDRDQVVVVDLESMTVTTRIALNRGDEPGRIVEDAAGQLHVALRSGGAVAVLDIGAGAVKARLSFCRYPRGLAYDARVDTMHVACAGGELVSYGATTGAASRNIKLDRDLRDVVVDGSRLLVSRFRAAELLVVEASGTVSSRLDALASTVPTSFEQGFRPAVLWRTIGAPGGGAIMVYQLVPKSPLGITAGGYGGSCRQLIVTGVTVYRAGGPTVSTLGILAVLPVDIASDGGNSLAVASAATPPLRNLAGVPPFTRLPLPGGTVDGGSGTVPMDASRFAEEPEVETDSFVQSSSGAGLSGSGGAGPGSIPCRPPPPLRPEDAVPSGRVIGLAFDPSGGLVVLTREPSMLLVGTRSVLLSEGSRKDTGHELFHLGTVAGIACASCHPEGHEDGQVWRFAELGARRTQSIRGGIFGTEPFHWGGDMTDFRALVHDVFRSRMIGPTVEAAHIDALANWINKLPAFESPPAADQAAIERGRALFNDPTIGCATCHAGTPLTNNLTMDVQTGAPFQVPSLRGLAWRAPYMHDGCAATLQDRFGSCGGGDAHGKTSGLTAADRADLVAYLETL